MKNIYQLQELDRYGVNLLTGEACGLGMRILCDYDEKGKANLESFLGTPLGGSSAWNHGAGSIMLTHETLRDFGLFMLAQECELGSFQSHDGELVGIETEEDMEYVRRFEKHPRIYKVRGTRGTRNEHVMSGRVI